MILSSHLDIVNGRAFLCTVLALVGTVPSAAAPPTIDPSERGEREAIDTVARVRATGVQVEYRAQRGRETIARIASGVAIDEAGSIVSVGIPHDSPQASISVVDSAGKRFKARWRGADPQTGITLLHADGLHAAALPLASAPIQPGAPVIVISNPYGLSHSVGFGHVGGLDRELLVGERHLFGLIQLLAPIHPGDNGALVANLRGEWVGIVRSCLSARNAKGEEVRASDIGFAIPAAQVRWIVAQLQSNGEVRRGYLGLGGSATADRGNGEGVRIGRVVPGSPAERAGLKPADRITAFDGRPVRSFSDLARHMDGIAPDARVRLTIVRDGAARVVEVRTGRRPEASSGSSSAPAEHRAETDQERKIFERIDALKRQIEQLERQLNLPADPDLDELELQP